MINRSPQAILRLTKAAVLKRQPASSMMYASLSVISLSIFAIILLCAVYILDSLAPPLLIALFIISVILGLAILIDWRQSEEDHSLSTDKNLFNFKPTSISLLIPNLVFLPGIVALLSSRRLQISYHGLFHSAYIFRVLAGQIPPENITMPGHPANVYWPYHAVLAVFTALCQIPPPLASSLLNIGALISVLILARKIIGFVTSHEFNLDITVFAIFSVFGGNLLGTIYTLIDKSSVTLTPTMPLGSDSRLNSLFEKFLNFYGFPIGVMIFLFALLIFIRILEKQERRWDIALFLIASLGALALHVTTGLFIAAVLPIAFAGTLLVNAFLSGASHLKEIVSTLFGATKYKRQTILSLVLLIVPIIATISFIDKSSRALPGTINIDWVSLYDIKSIFFASACLAPFFFIGIYQAIKRKKASVIFLGLVCIIGFLLTCIVTLPDQNEYKFIFLSTIAACMVATTVLLPIMRRPSLRILPIAAISLLCINLIMVGVSRFQSPWFKDRTFGYKGRHVYAQMLSRSSYPDIQYADVYEWARENTPTDTILIIPRIHKDRATAYVLAERVPYIVNGHIYNQGAPQYKQRSDNIIILFSTNTTEEDKHKALEQIRCDLPHRPMLIVYPKILAFSEVIRNGINPKMSYAGKVATGYFLSSTSDSDTK